MTRDLMVFELAEGRNCARNDGVEKMLAFESGG